MNILIRLFVYNRSSTILRMDLPRHGIKFSEDGKPCLRDQTARPKKGSEGKRLSISNAERKAHRGLNGGDRARGEQEGISYMTRESDGTKSSTPDSDYLDITGTALDPANGGCNHEKLTDLRKLGGLKELRGGMAWLRARRYTT